MSGARAAGPDGIEGVLLAQPPAFGEADAAAMGQQAFGIASTAARNLGSERDQTFMLLDADGAGLAILKVSNPAEDPATLDMEALVAFHAVRADPGLAVAQPRRSPAAGPATAGSDDAAAYRVRWEHDGLVHWLRAYDLLPGRA